ncbi:MAG: hypothetical protein GYB31_01125 [Bacteroidetes bacterium]|nr:hypothetical protein [Bacteroidota bacterium]
MDDFPQQLESLFRAKGQAAKVVEGVCWINYRSMAEPRHPVSRPAQICREQANEIRKELGARLIRWHGPPSRAVPKQKDWFVVRCQQPRLLEDMSSGRRKKLRKAMRNLEVREVDIQLMLELGYGVYQKAFERYANNSPQSETSWKAEVDIERNYSDLVKYVGVFSGDQLVGYSKCYRLGKEELLVAVTKLDPDYLKQLSGELLIYRRQEIYLSSGHVKSIRSGFKTLDHETGFQDFLVEKFGYEKQPLNLHLQYAPLLRLSKPLWKTAARIAGKYSGPLQALSAQDDYAR